MSDETTLLTGSTRRMLKEFKALNIACEVVDGQINIIKYRTKAGNWRQLKGMLSEGLPLFSKMICDDKWWTYKLFIDQKIPTPASHYYHKKNAALDFIHQTGGVVVKPRFGAHGNGVQLGVNNEKTLVSAVKRARQHHRDILLQQQVKGRDLRILVIGGKIISVLERLPASVQGDGKRTIAELIQLENQRPERGVAGIDALVQISELAARRYLSKESLDTIPKKNQRVRVVGPANHSMGGSVVDATGVMTPEIERQVITLTNYLKMPLAAVDCLLTSHGHYFLEINASPGIGIHDDNFAGVTTGCFTKYAKLLYNES